MQKKEVIIDGVKIAYIEKNTSADTVYVLLHGWGSTSDAFAPFFSRLPSYFAFDFPGHGASSPLKTPWTLADFSRLTKALVEKKLSGKKIIYVVHSFGGRVLLHLLAHFSNTVRPEKIYCIGVPFLREKGLRATVASLLLTPIRFLEKRLPSRLAKWGKTMWRTFFASADYTALRREVEKKTFSAIVSYHLSPLLPVLTHYDVVFCWGENDTMAPLSLAKQAAKQVHAPLYVIPHAGHFPFLGEYEELFFRIFLPLITQK